jgi:hypothetical protein
MVDFIGIGAQKAATTWLWAMLNQHPEVRFSPLKEVHYFDVLYLGSRRRAHFKVTRRAVKRQLLKLKGARDAQSVAKKNWLRRIKDKAFAFTDDWYRHLFAGQGNAVTGDITPLYCALPDAGVEHVKRLAPNARLIYMVRDPVERGASAVRYATRTGRSPHDIVRTKRFFVRGDYRTNITRWEKHFDSTQILYIPFGDVKRRPMEVLRAVEKHIGVSAFDGYKDVSVAVNITRGADAPLPADVQAKLVEMFGEQRAYLEERFGKDFVSRVS